MLLMCCHRTMSWTNMSRCSWQVDHTATAQTTDYCCVVLKSSCCCFRFHVMRSIFKTDLWHDLCCATSGCREMQMHAYNPFYRSQELRQANITLVAWNVCSLWMWQELCLCVLATAMGFAIKEKWKGITCPTGTNRPNRSVTDEETRKWAVI